MTPGGADRERVPDAELELLAVVQKRRAATAAEVREAIAPFRPLAHSSVVTLLNRLESRGLVTRSRGDQGKAFVYRPTGRGDNTVKPLLRRLVTRLYGGNPIALVASLFETRPPTAKEIDELERMVAELRERRKR